MATIDNIGSTYVANNSAKESTKTKTIGKDDFLKMLLAQLKNQDPMNPLQGTEFASQLAQFSSLEQLTNLNDTLTVQGKDYANLVNVQSVSLIGKEIIAKTADTIIGSDADAQSTITGKVTAVSFKDHAIYLTVNGQEVAFSDVLSVK